MSELIDDGRLLADFSQRSSEEAFRELVRRYTSLVYATALRSVFVSSAAEEITQNVFIVLARKASSLPRDVRLPAWLHRTAVLEARNWLRGEIRRRRREAEAHELGTAMNDQDSPLHTLSAVLDDALLDLREKDRHALLLRFMERRDLSSVGRALGVSEDTAQKRVGKALQLLTHAFRRRGYTVPATALTIAVLEGAAQSAPLGLAAGVGAAALAAAPPATLSGAALLLAKFMSLTKTQTAAVCLLLGAVPAALEMNSTLQARAEASETGRSHAGLLDSANTAASERTALESALEGARDRFRGLNDDYSRRRPASFFLSAPDRLYGWSAQADFVRLPKSVLDQLRLTPPSRSRDEQGREVLHSGEVVNQRGEVSPVLLDALGITEEQRSAVLQAFRDLKVDFDAMRSLNTTFTNVMPPGIGFSRPEGEPLHTLRTSAFPAEGARFREHFKARIEAAIGPERADILIEKQAADDLNQHFAHWGEYESWVAVARQSDDSYTVATSFISNGSSLGGQGRGIVKWEELPEEVKAFYPREAAPSNLQP